MRCFMRVFYWMVDLGWFYTIRICEWILCLCVCVQISITKIQIQNQRKVEH